jgi:hypothetical protein
MNFPKLLLLATSLVVVCMVVPTMATQSPAGCTSNDFVLNIAKSTTMAYDETSPLGPTIITYTLSTGNPQNAGGTGCDVTNVDVTLTTPDGVPHICQIGGNYPIGTPVAVLCTVNYTVNSGDLLPSGVVTALGEAVGILNDAPGVDDPLDASKSVSVLVIHPAIDVTKECVDASGSGQPINFSGTVTNEGDVNLVDVTVVDSEAGTVLGPIDLDAGASAPYSGSYIPTTSPSTDTVVATGTDPLGNAVSDTNSATCEVVLTPAIDVTKECTDASGPGQPINFSGTVTNEGEVDLTDVNVVDSEVGTVLGPIDLAVGESASYSGSYIPTTSPSTDTVVATGTAVTTGETVSDTNSATCQVPGNQGCTPGFWKNNARNWGANAWGCGLSPDMPISYIFWLNEPLVIRGNGKSTITDPTLLEALDANGGGVNAMIRHGIAAILNACSPCVTYAINDPIQIVYMIEDTLNGVPGAYTVDELHYMFAGYNEAGCPVNQHGECMADMIAVSY